MIDRLRCLTAAALLFAPAASAVTVQITPIASCGDVTVRAEPLCSGDLCPKAVSSLPGTVHLDEAFAWSLAAVGPGCWGETVTLPAGVSRPSRATIRVWPAAMLRGRFTIPRGATPPTSLEARITSAPGAAAAIGETAVPCTIDGDGWNCSVPTEALDVRLSAPGFVPHYVWGVTAPADLNAVSLMRGSSLAGYVAFDGPEPPPMSAVTIEAGPEVLGDAPDTEQRLASRNVTVKPNVRGFFQFRDLAPGSYRVVARAEKWSTVRMHDVRVEAGREAVVERIDIRPLAAVEVYVDPPADPLDKPWTIEIAGPYGSPAARQSTDAAGIARVESVASGQCRLSVVSSRGVRFASQSIDVHPLMPPVNVQVKIVEVRGVVTSGSERVPSRLSFQNSALGGPVYTTTDQHAVFRVFVAAEGTWNVQVTPLGEDGEAGAHGTVYVDVPVQKQEGKRFAWAEIELASGSLHGRVVDRHGAPAAGVVILKRPDGRTGGMARAGADGEFRFDGVEPGEVRLLANSEGKGRGQTAYRLLEGATGDVTIRLQSTPEIRGRVVTSFGAPVAGAMLQYFDGHAMQDVTTGPGGEFELQQYAAGLVDVAVIAPGYPLRLVTLPVRGADDPPVDVAVGGPYGLLDIRMPRVPPFAFLRRHGSAAAFHVPLLGVRHLPRGNPSRDPASVGPIYEVDPGTYLVCPTYHVTEQCITAVVPPGGRANVDTNEWSR